VSSSNSVVEGLGIGATASDVERNTNDVHTKLLGALEERQSVRRSSAELDA